MPAGNEKSRSRRRTSTVTPGAHHVTRFTRRPTKRASCHFCGGTLNATKKLHRKKLGSLSKTERRAERPYGGEACGTCLRDGIIRAVRTTSLTTD